MGSDRAEEQKANDPTRAALWELAQGVREAIRKDSGPREESIGLAFVVEKLVDKAESSLPLLTNAQAAVLDAVAHMAAWFDAPPLSRAFTEGQKRIDAVLDAHRDLTAPTAQEMNDGMR
jgi:hypothetical protein